MQQRFTPNPNPNCNQCQQLNSTMHLISGTLCSTPLLWLTVLSIIEPPALQRKAATDKLVEKIMTVGQSRLISFTHHCYD